MRRKDLLKKATAPGKRKPKLKKRRNWKKKRKTGRKKKKTEKEQLSRKETIEYLLR